MIKPTLQQTITELLLDSEIDTISVSSHIINLVFSNEVLMAVESELAVIDADGREFGFQVQSRSGSYKFMDTLGTSVKEMVYKNDRILLLLDSGITLAILVDLTKSESGTISGRDHYVVF